MRKLIAFSLAAAVLTASGAASAQTERGSPQSRDQVQQRAAEAFARMDVNGDGVIDQADREARRQQMFDRLDANRDGSISREEFAAQRERRGEARAERGTGTDRSFARRGMRGPGGMQRGGEARGPITQEQFVASALERFDRIDTDNDGTISAEERRAAREQMRTMRRERRQG
jgi:Ca2+-binding EF-hand superfamily protein